MSVNGRLVEARLLQLTPDLLIAFVVGGGTYREENGKWSVQDAAGNWSPAEGVSHG